MSQVVCKRIWEGTIGIRLVPQKKRDGNYYWTFSFVRAFKRNSKSPWEYAQHYSQWDAERLGKALSKAYQFMEQNDATEFMVEQMAAANAAATESQGLLSSKAA